MLERINRLREKELFQRLFSHGSRYFLGNIAGFTLPLKDGNLVVGVTFKQKAFRTAVLRHLYKRKTLAWVRKHLSEFPRGKAIVIHFQIPFPSPFTGNIEQSLAKLLEKLRKI